MRRPCPSLRADSRGLAGALLAGALLVSLTRPVAAGTFHAALPEAVRAGHCDDLDTDSLIHAIEAELPHLRLAKSAARYGHRRMKSADYARSTLEPLLAAARRGQAALCTALQHDFELYPLAGASGRSRGHFSAYCHPVLHGSRHQTERFRIPLYRRPPEPAASLTTAEILDGGLAGRALELCYVDSPLTALNVHIEGSATVRLEDGSEINLTTDGHNGHPYTNPFKLARKDGLPPPETSAAPSVPIVPTAPTAPTVPAEAPSFRSKLSAFFAGHPDLLRQYWAKNPHYVFFKETPLRGTGKFGELVPGRSVAIDQAQVPMGAALWMHTELATAPFAPDATSDATSSVTPDAAPASGGAAGVAAGPSGEGEGAPRRSAGAPVRYTPIARLALAQDTGAAIRGRGRVDVFVGSGAAARVAAALTSRPGELYLVVKKPARSPARSPAEKAATRRHHHRRKSGKTSADLSKTN